jgi:hypothetical protein
MARTTITIPRNILGALRIYTALNNITLREQSSVVEAALKRYFENHDININKADESVSHFQVSPEGKEKISVSIRDNLLKALRIYIAYQGLTQHDQSKVVVLALKEFFLENKIPIDDRDEGVIKFDVISEDWHST